MNREDGFLESTNATRLRPRDWATVLVVSVVAFFSRSWEGNFDLDPLHYAAAAKTMAVTGEWLVVQDQPGSHYFTKPPLFFWLTAVNYELFGVTTAATRFWTALSGVAACLVTAAFGRDLFGRAAGLLAGCMLATSSGMIMTATSFKLDPPMTLVAVTSAYIAWIACRQDKPHLLIWCGVVAGVGGMVKQPGLLIGLCMPLLLLPWTRPRWLLHWWIPAALAVAFAIVAPWHIAVWNRVGSEFFDIYLGREVVERFERERGVFASVTKALSSLANETIPWFPLAIAGGVYARRAQPDVRLALRFFLGWLVFVVIMTAAPERQYQRYAEPACPAVALLAAYAVARIGGVAVEKRAQPIVLTLAFVAAVVVALLPFPVRETPCNDYVAARPIMDGLGAGDTVGIVDPEVAPGLSVAHSQYFIRAPVWFYLDRTLYSYATAQDAFSDGQAVLTVNAKYEEECEEYGYVPLDVGPVNRRARLVTIMVNFDLLDRERANDQ